MSNACFGKTKEKLRKRPQIKFLSNPQPAEIVAQRATFESFHIIEQDLVSVFLEKSFVVWTKPTPVGASTVDLSKLPIHEFYSEEMVTQNSSDQLQLAYKKFVIYPIETPDLYKDMACFKHLLDLSDYPKDHYLSDPKKSHLPMTDELQGKVLREIFVCFRSKLYSIDYVGGKKQSDKGVEKKEKQILSQDSLGQCLFSLESFENNGTVAFALPPNSGE